MRKRYWSRIFEAITDIERAGNIMGKERNQIQHAFLASFIIHHSQPRSKFKSVLVCMWEDSVPSAQRISCIEFHTRPGMSSYPLLENVKAILFMPGVCQKKECRGFRGLAVRRIKGPGQGRDAELHETEVFKNFCKHRALKFSNTFL